MKRPALAQGCLLGCAAALMLVSAGAVWAQLPDKSPGRSEITAKNVACGMLASHRAGRLPGTSPTGAVTRREGFRIEKETRDIPARHGIEFGILYTLKSFLGTGTTPIRVVFTYPAPGLRNPKTGKVSLSTETTFDKRYDVEQMDSYTFEEEWELVPGKWQVQVFDRQKKLAECTFNVAEPERAGPPGAAGSRRSSN